MQNLPVEVWRGIIQYNSYLDFIHLRVSSHLLKDLLASEVPSLIFIQFMDSFLHWKSRMIIKSKSCQVNLPFGLVPSLNLVLLNNTLDDEWAHLLAAVACEDNYVNPPPLAVILLKNIGYYSKEIRFLKRALPAICTMKTSTKNHLRVLLNLAIENDEIRSLSESLEACCFHRKEEFTKFILNLMPFAVLKACLEIFGESIFVAGCCRGGNVGCLSLVMEAAFKVAKASNTLLNGQSGISLNGLKNGVATALHNHHESIIIYLLSHFQFLDLAENNNMLLKTSVISGLNSLFTYLMEERLSEIDPAPSDDFCILKACTKGHVDMVAMLLVQPQVNPSMNENRPLKIACLFGYADIVKLLLNHPRVCPQGDLGRATVGFFAEFPIVLAAKNNHVEVLELLLEDGRAKADCQKGEALVKAAQNGSFEALELLLKLPAFNSNTRVIREAIKWASRMGRLDCCRVLRSYLQEDEEDK